MHGRAWSGDVRHLERRPEMKVGILGAGSIGRAFARSVVRSGGCCVISNSRGPESLADLVAELGTGARAGTVAEAVQEEIVFLAIPWPNLPDAVGFVPDWENRIVIDATNAVGAEIDPDGRTSSEIVADLVPGARLVKAFNTLHPEWLAADPHVAGGRRVVFYSGDDARAKAEVSRLIDRLGFAGIDLGHLAEGGRLQQVPGGPLPALNLIRLD
jgi:predicted dinucleotide-binding enzyme